MPDIDWKKFFSPGMLKSRFIEAVKLDAQTWHSLCTEKAEALQGGRPADSPLQRESPGVVDAVMSDLGTTFDRNSRMWSRKSDGGGDGRVAASRRDVKSPPVDLDAEPLQLAESQRAVKEALGRFHPGIVWGLHVVAGTVGVDGLTVRLGPGVAVTRTGAAVAVEKELTLAKSLTDAESELVLWVGVQGVSPARLVVSDSPLKFGLETVRLAIVEVTRSSLGRYSVRHDQDGAEWSLSADYSDCRDQYVSACERLEAVLAGRRAVQGQQLVADFRAAISDKRRTLLRDWLLGRTRELVVLLFGIADCGMPRDYQGETVPFPWNIELDRPSELVTVVDRLSSFAAKAAAAPPAMDGSGVHSQLEQVFSKLEATLARARVDDAVQVVADFRKEWIRKGAQVWSGERLRQRVCELVMVLFHVLCGRLDGNSRLAAFPFPWTLDENAPESVVEATKRLCIFVEKWLPCARLLDISELTDLGVGELSLGSHVQLGEANLTCIVSASALDIEDSRDCWPLARLNDVKREFVLNGSALILVTAPPPEEGVRTIVTVTVESGDGDSLELSGELSAAGDRSMFGVLVRGSKGRRVVKFTTAHALLVERLQILTEADQ